MGVQSFAVQPNLSNKDTPGKSNKSEQRVHAAMVVANRIQIEKKPKGAMRLNGMMGPRHFEGKGALKVP